MIQLRKVSKPVRNHDFSYLPWAFLGMAVRPMARVPQR